MEKVNALEILREAMHIEKEGGKFYTRAAKVCRDRFAAEVFTRLAGDELNHLEKLELVYDNLAENSEWLVEMDLLNPGRKVLEATEVFDNDISPADDGLDQAGAIDRGIKAEEDSIRLYKKALEGCKGPNAGGTAVFKWLLDFEKGHLKELKELKQKLAGSD
jgi:rubrerythrin